LTGIRRSGKTTILFQYIDYLLKNSGAQRIVYVKMDDIQGKIDSIHDILDIYHELTGIDPVRETVYFLLDEIHVRKDCQLQLKYWDQFLLYSSCFSLISLPFYFVSFHLFNLWVFS